MESTIPATAERVCLCVTVSVVSLCVCRCVCVATDVCVLYSSIFIL